MKRDVSELAALGGGPLFQEKLHVGRPHVGDRAWFMERVTEVLDSRWLSNHGRCVQELEAQLAQRLGVRHCILVCNATVGLEITVRALGLEGEVILPSLTFVASAHALLWQKLVPVFCDVSPRTHLLDPRRVEAAITPRTSAILGVHLWGRGCAVDELQDIAHRHGLPLIFDAAHAFGCSYRGRMIGGFGRAEVFSFHATKVMNTFEGGAITTNDDALARRIRPMVAFGFTNAERVVSVGTNGKMNEVCAAMGLASLRNIDEVMARNARNFVAYERALRGVPGVRVLPYDPAERHNYQYVVLEYDAPAGAIERDELLAVLWAENVMARRYFHPGCHGLEPYRSMFPAAEAQLPQTVRLAQRLIVLPTGDSVSERDAQAIAAVMRVAIEAGAAQLHGLRDTA